MERNRDPGEEDEILEVQESLEDIELARWRPSEADILAIQHLKEAAPPSSDYPVLGDANEIERLSLAFQALESTEVGRPIAIAIRENGTTIAFGTTEDGAIAQFDPAANEITIHDSQKEASPAVLAAHLAHEGTHVQWAKPDSIEQEYAAFKAEAEVWNVLKGDESDEQCDWVSAMIAQGEDRAKDEIRSLYDLPEF
ncbi:MAG: hypothetical protein NZ823_10635 [Blastocatellia bacterium]|nr:hypothetical protein [Blastocatellia bacterium]